jgi:hypothetical protein
VPGIATCPPWIQLRGIVPLRVTIAGLEAA